jgi:hypothetical protein
MTELGVTFGLLVTGVGEGKFLPKLFQSLRDVGPFRFEVIRKIEQLRPRSAPPLPRLTMPGGTIPLSTRDEDLGLWVRGYLQGNTNRMVIVVDDLEFGWKDRAEETFNRYRLAIDTIIKDPKMQRRASVHFLVMMLEAYFFADSKAVNEALGAEILVSDYAGDVESIRHPKGDLKNALNGYDEVRNGDEIIGRLNVEHVLSDPQTCASLRTLFAWCVEAILEFYPEFQGQFPDYKLEDGIQFSVTNGQLTALKRN